MNYEDWVSTVPKQIADDSLWKVEAYRLGLLAADIGWNDVTKLMTDKRTVSLSNQLFRSLGSVSANVAEGYSRASGKDKARFYEYALGSAREARDWYYKGRHLLGERVTEHRIKFVTQIVRLLLTMIPQQRAHGIHDSADNNATRLQELLTNVPL